MTTVADPMRVFISYTHEDDPYREQLEKHLAPFKQKGWIDIWHAGLVAPGSAVRQQIHENLRRADLIILIVSAAYLAQEPGSDNEMTLPLNMHRTQKIRLIPIIVKSASWQHTQLSEFQVLPRGHKPVASHDDKEEAFANIVNELSKVIKEIQNLREGSLSIEVERLRKENEKLSQQVASFMSQQREPVTSHMDNEKNLLVDFGAIRQAYRTVYKHQRQLFDQLALISDELTAAGLPFERWDPMYNARPAKSPSEFFRRNYWAWDFLPGYALRLVWKSKSQKIVIEAVSDTGYQAKRSEPDPVDFLPTTESKSQRWISLFSSDKSDIDWNPAWKLWSQSENIYDGHDHPIQVDGANCIYRYVEMDMTELGDQGSLRASLHKHVLAWLRDQRSAKRSESPRQR